MCSFLLLVVSILLLFVSLLGSPGATLGDSKLAVKFIGVESHEDLYHRCPAVLPADPEPVVDTALAEGSSAEESVSYLVWLTHYVAEGTSASGEPSRVGHIASYPRLDSRGAIVGVTITGQESIDFGTRAVVEGVGEFSFFETGGGFPKDPWRKDKWADVAVSSRGEAERLGARWAIVTILKEAGVDPETV